MTVDVQELRQEAESILDNPDLWRLHSFANAVLELLDEFEVVARKVAAL